MNIASAPHGSMRDPSDRADLLALWALVPYFEGLPDDIIHALAQAARSKSYGAGAIIFLEGEPTAGLFMIETGTVKISRYAKDGREHILHFLDQGSTFNDVSVLDGGPNPATATAQTDVVIWNVKRSDLQQIATCYPALSWALVESIARRARYLISLVQDLSMRSVRGRLARLLLEQAAESAANDVPRMLTQEEMASQLGTVREVVGRALRSLTADGIIEFDRHHIVILEPARLAKEAEA